MFRRKHYQVPALNTTSTADISFMLLIFFLVTSSMDADKGLPRQLPPPEDYTEQQLMEVKQRNVLQLELGAHDELLCQGEPVTAQELTARVEEFVANRDDLPSLPEKSLREVHLLGLCQVSDRHVILIHTHRQATYDAYFTMQNAIVRGYHNLRNSLAMQQFRLPYDQCSQEQHDAIMLVYPQRISEQVEQKKEGGEP